MEYNKLKRKSWFINMINDYTAPHIFIREESDFLNEYINYLDSKK